MDKYQVLVIGSGPSGIFTTLELLKYDKNMKILMLDEGRNIKVRKCPKSKTNNAKIAHIKVTVFLFPNNLFNFIVLLFIKSPFLP